jgi:hypothetical protein
LKILNLDLDQHKPTFNMMFPHHWQAPAPPTETKQQRTKMMCVPEEEKQFSLIFWCGNE